MTLLKIGTLNIPRNRWKDALDLFDIIYVFCYESEIELQNEKIHYIKVPNKPLSWISSKCIAAVYRFNNKKQYRFLQLLAIAFLKILYRKYINRIPFTEIDYIHSSYNDFDESNLFTLLLPNKYYITRAQKETRIENNNLEYHCLKRCQRIILNDKFCQSFFEDKYGKKIFYKKSLLLNLDEDVRSIRLRDEIQYSEKLSKFDNRIHAVILAGRVLCNKEDKRSGGRLYYYDTINDLLNSGFVVHLHTKQIIPFNDENQYEELALNNQDFKIEAPLDFENDSLQAYSILSRYDIGILHAMIKTESVYLFDRVNIPHRYYEYILAHVCPIVREGETIVTEKIIKEKKMGIVYKKLSDIRLDMITNMIYDNTFFYDYITSIYPKQY